MSYLANPANKFVTSGGRKGENYDASWLGEQWGGGRRISGINVCLFLFISVSTWGYYIFLIFRFDLEEAVDISESSCNTRKDNKQTYLRSNSTTYIFEIILNLLAMKTHKCILQGHSRSPHLCLALWSCQRFCW